MTPINSSTSASTRFDSYIVYCFTVKAPFDGPGYYSIMFGNRQEFHNAIDFRYKEGFNWVTVMIDFI